VVPVLNLAEKAKVNVTFGAVLNRRLRRSSNAVEGEQKCTYCCKFFAGYHMPKDGAYNSRCIPIEMTAGSPPKDEIKPKDEEGMSEIRVKLLIWRMQNHFEPLTIVDRTDLKLSKATF
jgi:hypothetical protein